MEIIMSQRYNTKNPRPSNSMKDLNDNALAYDDIINSDAEDAIDRFSRVRRTWFGMERHFDRLMNGFSSAFDALIIYFKDKGSDAISGIGWQELGNWAVNLTLTNRQQVVWYNNAWYKYIGELPHTITGDSPENDGGIWSAGNPIGVWVNIGDAALRNDLAADNGLLLVSGGHFGRADVAISDVDSVQISTYFRRVIYLTDLASKSTNGDWSQAFQYINDYSDQYLAVVIPAGVYKTSVALAPKPGTIVVSQGATIHVTADNPMQPGILCSSGVQITGDLTIQLDDVTNRSWKRAHIRIGDYDTGVGEKNIKISGVTLLGGHDDINGIFITGDSHNISIDSISVPGSNDKIGRVVLAHWGGANYHNRNSDGSETHIPGTYTTHPHNISIGSIDAGDLTNSYGVVNRTNCGVVFLSAAYNVSVERISVNRCQQVVSLYGSDFGFTYANSVTKGYGQRGISINNVLCNQADYRALTILAMPNYTTDLIGCQSSFSNWYVGGNRLDSFNSSGIVCSYAVGVNFKNVRVYRFKNKGLLLEAGCHDVNGDIFVDVTGENGLTILGSIQYPTSRIRLHVGLYNSNSSASSDPIIGSGVYASSSVSSIDLTGNIGSDSSQNSFVHGIYINRAVDVNVKARIGVPATSGFCAYAPTASYDDRISLDGSALRTRNSISGPFISFDGHGNKVIYSPTPPTGGTWVEGDTCINITPAVGRSDRWRYNATGIWISTGFIPAQ